MTDWPVVSIQGRGPLGASILGDWLASCIYPGTRPLGSIDTWWLIGRLCLSRDEALWEHRYLVTGWPVVSIQGRGPLGASILGDWLASCVYPGTRPFGSIDTWWLVGQLCLSSDVAPWEHRYLVTDWPVVSIQGRGPLGASILGDWLAGCVYPGTRPFRSIDTW